MTHRGPFQPLLFCDSVILTSAGSRNLRINALVAVLRRVVSS